MRKLFVVSVVFSLSLLGFSPSSNALEYIRLSGEIQNATANPSSVSVRLWLKGQYGGAILANADVNGRGAYSILVPKNTPVDISLINSSVGNSAVWSSTATYTQDTVLNFNIPNGIKISGRLVDAQGNPLSNARVSMDGFNDPMDPVQISSDGNLWTGRVQRQFTNVDALGNFEIYSYPTGNIGFKRNLTVEGIGTPGFRWVSSKQLIDGPKQFVVCVPINFNSTNTLPDYCIQDEKADFASSPAGLAAAAKERAEKAIAELKARQEAKAAADLLAKQAAEAKAVADKANLKRTIICLKGKIVKKITNANPKCPSGYKVKK